MSHEHEVNPYSPPKAEADGEIVEATPADAGTIELKYDVQIDDLVCLSVFHHSQSSYARGPQTVRRILLGSIFLLLALPLIVMLPRVALNSVLGGVYLFLICLLPVMALINFAFYPALMRRRIRSQVLRMYSEGSNLSVLGPHQLRISETALEISTQVARHTYDWAGIERIERAQEGVYFYCSAVTAQIVPNRAFDSDAELSQFLKTAEYFWKGATETSPGS